MTRTQVIGKASQVLFPAPHRLSLQSHMEMRFNGESCVYLSTLLWCSLRLSSLPESPFVLLCCTSKCTLSLPRECVASSWACREHPVHRPHLGSVACSLSPRPPPKWGGVRSFGGELVFWCPDVVSAGFPSLWTTSREQACRVEAYNLPDLLSIYSLKRWGQSMLILTLVINTLLPPYTNLYLAINVTGVILSFIAWCHWSSTLVLFSL